MSGERYVPNGVILICTHGASFGFFQVTFHVDTSIYASNMGTEGDRWPLLNIPSFGACIATPNVPCFPSPVTWQQPRDGIYINNNQMLLENSTAKCMRGGTVSIRFTFANLQESPSGSFKRPSEYIKDGFDWVFGKLDDNLADVRAGLADMGAPVWLQNGIDQLAWNTKMSVGIVEGALNGVVGLGELIWDVATDPIGVGSAIVDGVCDGATSAWEWGSKGDNWTKAANDSWEWASDGDNWTKAASDADQWLKDNPRVVGNVTGEVLLEVGAAALTGGGSLGASAVKKAGKELVEETFEYGTKKLLKEGGEEAAEQSTKAIVKDGAEETVEQGLKKSTPEVLTKTEWDKIRKYIHHLEKTTELKLHPKQIQELKDALRKNRYEKLSPTDTAKKRIEFNKNKDNIIKEWEKQTAQKWPTYDEVILDKNGNVYRKVGDKYDAHHVIENNYGGDDAWWNIHPAKSPSQHQGGIHGKGAPANDVFR